MVAQLVMMRHAHLQGLIKSNEWRPEACPALFKSREEFSFQVHVASSFLLVEFAPWL